MTRLFATFVMLLLTAVAVPQDTTKPAEPKGDEKKAEPKKVVAKGEIMGDDEEVDVQKTADRIAENAQKAGGRLKDKDPGEETRKIQKDIIKDIDALLKKAQQPPPPSPDMPPPMPPMMPPPKSDIPPPKSDVPMPKDGVSGGMPPPKSPMPMGSSTGSSQPKANLGGSGSSSSGGKADRRPRKERRPRGDSPMGMGDPMANAGGMQPIPARPEPKDGPNDKQEKPGGDGSGAKFGLLSPKRQNDKLADLYKDVWGNLPDRMRQEMDLYYREQFMPRYSELLRQYYAALAEQRKKGTEDR
jgi:hypothetical protein